MFSGGPPVHLMWSNVFNPDKPRIKKPVDWRRIYALFRPYAHQQAQVLLCTLAISLLGVVPPLCSMRIIDDAIPQHNWLLSCLYIGGMILSAVISAAIGACQGYLNALVGEGIVRDLRSRLVSHLHRMPLEFFANTKTGEIMNRVSSDVESVDAVLTGTLGAVITNVFVILTTLCTIVFLDWRLALTSILVIPLMVFPMWPVGRKMYEIRKRTREKRDQIESVAQETLSISGITLIKAFVREDSEAQRFHAVGSSLMQLEVKLAMVGRWFLGVVTAMVTIGPAVVWLIGSWLAIHSGVTVGVVVTFVALLSRLYGPASALAGVQIQMVSALAVFERIFDYLDMDEEEGTNEKTELEALEGAIEFDRVSFAYSERRPALHELSFLIEPGKAVAFVGPSGAGKTTIAQLVLRFYHPQSGSIRIDGHDVRAINIYSLRSHIGIVTQETYLFHDTIMNNLRYARQDASDQEVFAAAQAAHIHDFVRALPDGYQTVVGERGHKLSGGERQRLAIARVLLKDPKILILDEATSSLDSHNEAAIQAALLSLMQGRTSLVIAHRLSTIANADVIHVLEEGRLVESGTHADLLSQQGLYAKLYWQQFKETRAISDLC